MNAQVLALADTYNRIGRRLANYRMEYGLDINLAFLSTLAVEYHYIGMLIRTSDDINQTIEELSSKDIPRWKYIYEKRNKARHIAARTLKDLVKKWAKKN